METMDRKRASVIMARGSKEERRAAAAILGRESGKKSAAAKERVKSVPMPTSTGRPARALEDIRCTCPVVLVPDAKGSRQMVIDVEATLRPSACPTTCPRGRAQRRRQNKN